MGLLRPARARVHGNPNGFLGDPMQKHVIEPFLISSSERNYPADFPNSGPVFRLMRRVGRYLLSCFGRGAPSTSKWYDTHGVSRGF